MKTWSLLLCLAFFSAAAQKPSYNLATVPEELKNNANVITHLENISLEVESTDRATVNFQKIFTVVNADGKDALVFNEYQTHFVTLDEAEIKVYDAHGKQVGKYKKKDMVTVAVGEGLIEDGYVTYYRITPPSYPVTVEVNYQQKLKSTLFLPDFRYIHEKESVIQANYTATVPAEINLRYQAKHSNLNPEVTEDGKKKVYKWSVNNLPAVENEAGSVSAGNRFPHVKIVTDQFSHYGFRGDLSSWKSFGDWLNNLYAGLDELPAGRQKFFQQLVSNAPDDKEKIRRIYRYMQENFRYVSIQLGIGGLKPFSASFTDQKKYGDCKGLSNYMKAALKAVGIPSYVAIINGEYNGEPVDPVFPANKFNHVILCVPGPKDSIWLECTSNTAEFGKLGTFTENRNALLVTENGGVLVPTPSSNPSSNLISSHTTVKFADDLSGEIDTRMTPSGAFLEVLDDVLKSNKDDQKYAIVYLLGYKQPDYFEFSDTLDGNHRQVRLMLGIRKLSEFNAGSKHFLYHRVSRMWSGKLPLADKRKMDFYFRFPFERTDTTIIKLTLQFRPDVLPGEKEMKSAYGYYHAKSWYNEKEHAVYTYTRLVLKKHKILAGDYASVKSFFDEVAQDDAQRIVVKKSEGTESKPAIAEKKAF